MGFFDIQESDMVSNSDVKFKAGEHASFVIAKIVKKVISEKDKVIIETVVIGGDYVGQKKSFWFSTDSEGGRKALGIFLTTFLTAKEASEMEDPNILINRKFECDFIDNNGYVNERNCKEISDVPASMATPQVQSTPQEQTVTLTQTPAQATDMSKSIFG